MGFSGGGSNILKAHKHDGTVVQDGGSLDFDNITQADLTAGDVVYSNGTHLQRLAIGAATNQLAVNGAATAPEWVAGGGGGGGKLELIEHWVNTGAALTTKTITLSPAVDQDDIAEIYVVSGGSSGGNTVNLRVNGLTTNYNQHGSYIVSGTQTIINSTAETGLQSIIHSFGEPHFIQFHIAAGNSNASSSIRKIRVTATGGGSTGWISYSGVNTTSPITSISSITLYNSSDSVIESGTWIDVYKVNNS